MRWSAHRSSSPTDDALTATRTRSQSCSGRFAGGGQFGVVTSLVFATVPEPLWQCSFHRDDDLALGASLVDVGQGFLGGLEREDTIDDGADDA